MMAKGIRWQLMVSSCRSKDVAQRDPLAEISLRQEDAECLPERRKIMSGLTVDL